MRVRVHVRVCVCVKERGGGRGSRRGEGKGTYYVKSTEFNIPGFSLSLYGSGPHNKTYFVIETQQSSFLEFLFKLKCRYPVIFILAFPTGWQSVLDKMTWAPFALKCWISCLEAQPPGNTLLYWCGYETFVKKMRIRWCLVFCFYFLTCLEFVVFLWFQPHIGQMSSGTFLQQLCSLSCAATDGLETNILWIAFGSLFPKCRTFCLLILKLICHFFTQKYRLWDPPASFALTSNFTISKCTPKNQYFYYL